MWSAEEKRQLGEEWEGKQQWKIADEGGEKWKYQNNTTLHRRREYRPPAALGNAAKNDCQHAGEK